MSRLPVAAMLVVALAGCQPDAGSSASPAPAPASGARDGTATASTEVAGITGTALYRERIMPPAGSRLKVRLIDNLLVDGRQADTPQAIIAEAVVEDVGAPPIPFVLEYDPARIRDNGMYGLYASLIGADGSLLFVTDTRQAVTPGSDAPVELLLVAASAAAPPPASGSVAHRSHWQCGELRVDASYDPAIDATTLSYSGRNLVLPTSVTASGERYADGDGNEFRRKGDSAILAMSGRPQVQCTPTDTPSPWTEAAERGIAFRAAGNEPGWWVEIGSGPSPSITAVLDYGERSLEVTDARPNGNGYAGTATDGSPVRLSIERQACADGMSGEDFDASARLSVDDRIYQGCGAFLRD